ncbi:hypothetical protein BU25DRAFT_233269 [Macroventuria anomochaeta]|uniref:Uncharacterized protein n=1 Tax=Macroventuria anomochaeta TaxID=301207 RepID=A0ACB6RL63_9PLEO|nr:uncharacterized protein BU25DRAFT_233269 [Macroventuria anomochaeta]KAF2621712.1 hypothetical protein BU25DRAFT_233269 [Macroventuria anomochaeta]
MTDIVYILIAMPRCRGRHSQFKASALRPSSRLSSFYVASTTQPQPSLLMMQLTSFLTVAFASIAAAAPDFGIGTGTRVTAKDSAQLASMTKALLEAASSYQASLTAQPEWTSAYSALVEFQETGKNVPEGVTATDRILTFATTPDWQVNLLGRGGSQRNHVLMR